MTAHKHAELIKAKADNMELVVFAKYNKYWQETSQMPFQEEFDYFLCLPKHKEACLHWLSGGSVQYRHGVTQKWGGYGPTETWTAGSIFMQEYVDIRIKPRKEKRWIAVKWDNFYVLPRHYETKEGAEKAAASSMAGEFQYKEIEVEV